MKNCNNFNQMKNPLQMIIFSPAFAIITVNKNYILEYTNPHSYVYILLNRPHLHDAHIQYIHAFEKALYEFKGKEKKKLAKRIMHAPGSTCSTKIVDSLNNKEWNKWKEVKWNHNFAKWIGVILIKWRRRRKKKTLKHE